MLLSSTPTTFPLLHCFVLYHISLTSFFLFLEYFQILVFVFVESYDKEKEPRAALSPILEVWMQNTYFAMQSYKV